MLNQNASAVPIDAKIYVAGHTGLAGASIVRKLKQLGYQNLILPARSELDLTHYESVRDFFTRTQPEYVFLCAAKIGGIIANKTYPGAFIYQNLMIQTHVIHEAMRHGVKRLFFLGSSCLYPKACSQPMKEEHHLSGNLEFTNRPYAVAKIAGIEMCWAYNREYNTRFFAAMPTNLYGPEDNYDLATAYVLPALLRRMHDAKISGQGHLTLWGTGTARREFLHCDDFAEAAVFLMTLKEPEFAQFFDQEKHPPLINIGSGTDLTIKELAHHIAGIIGFKGQILWDPSKPDGTPQKLLDVSLLSNLGWKSSISLRDGIKQIYAEESQKWKTKSIS